jgi:A/G-specific adenine glycosylase
MIDFSPQIIDWYRRTKRNLPWRNTNNPYFIWLSEIILQQTRVNQGMDYYHKFINNYPTVIDLANADEQSVLNDWQGLGYYSRARNLHATAKIIKENYNGVFPSSYNEILKLKGVGSYTASAISSFAYNLPYAVVDGNVYRVLSRVFDINTPIDSNKGQKDFSILAQELLNKSNPSEHNQAIMEFGALQCTPTNPTCLSCVLQESCLSLRNNTIQERPIKKGKTKIRSRYFHYLHFEDQESIIVQKRTKNDIWQHLFEFPLIEKESEIDEEIIRNEIIEQTGIEPISITKQPKHILSHQHIYATFWKFNSLPKEEILNSLIINKKDLPSYPISRMIDKYLDNV